MNIEQEVDFYYYNDSGEQYYMSPPIYNGQILLGGNGIHELNFLNSCANDYFFLLNLVFPITIPLKAYKQRLGTYAIKLPIAVLQIICEI